MADDTPTLPLYEIPWLRLYPWLRLFHAPGAAADPKRLMLAALGLILLHAGWSGLDHVWPVPDAGTRAVLVPWEPLAIRDLRAGTVLGLLAEPVRVLTAPFRVVLSPDADLLTFTHAALAAAWVLLIWGLIGGAIARVAALDLARGERIGLGAAVRFAMRKAPALLGSPMLPLFGLAAVTASLALFGLLYRLPGTFGTTAAGVLAFLPLLGGLVLAVVVVGLAAGWPLMHAAVAAEAEDGFDAMSRAYAYSRQRPWHYVLYVLLAAAAGGVGFVFIDLFAQLVVALSRWGLSFGGPAGTVAALYAEGKAVVPPAAVATHGFWLAAVGLLVHAWVYSYFWTVATTIYLLLRRDVDATPFRVVASNTPPGLLAEAAAQAAGKSG